ncbi:hypothetical protein EB796_022502 [Bugula neritina]|uniref:SLC29A1 n=1 Tax=Bugula neritina TaxID=10212 RepID=A0A7J7IZ79_BUGNE|nr:hypothetical protein EB796_022502 [Bugula neritina]
MMSSHPTENGSHPKSDTKGLIVGDQVIKNYHVIEPGTYKSSLHAPSPFASRVSAFGSKSSANAFGSVRSIASRASQRLAQAKPTLQSSWMNVAAPVPLGGSFLALNKQSEKLKSEGDFDRETTAPPDKFKLVYLIFILHGIGTLLPWNMFLTANSYFTDFKLAAKANETESEYAKNFLSYLGITAQFPNLILNAINIFCQCGGGRTTVKIAGSIVVLILMFIVTIVMAMVNSQEWQGAFFGLTMATVVVINMSSGVYQNCLYGIAGTFPMKYTNAVIVGSNVSGTLTAIIMIITLLASPSLQLAAIWYFIAAVITLCIALVTYFLLPTMKFYKHFTMTEGKTEGGSEKSLVADDSCSSSDESNTIERPPYCKIFKQIYPQLIGVWLTFFVSLVCFPAVQADIRPSDPNLFIPEKLYTPITTFLFFNLFATLGSLTTELIKKPGPRFVLIPIVLRFLYIPFFMLCNFRPELRSIPVYISNDYAYFAGGITMAFTSGYFSSLCMMYAPSLVEPKWAGTAAMISAFFLILGIVSGVQFTLVVSWLVEHI